MRVWSAFKRYVLGGGKLVRCPACDGCGGFLMDSMSLYGIPGGYDWGDRCEVCKGEGVVEAQAPLTEAERQRDALRERGMRAMGENRA